MRYFRTTEKSWHGFDKISLPTDRAHLTRKSIALYFYSKQRPAEEIAGKHTTHYVNQQIPRHIEAGYTLRCGCEPPTRRDIRPG
jgi:hypothetical protein